MRLPVESQLILNLHPDVEGCRRDSMKGGDPLFQGSVETRATRKPKPEPQPLARSGARVVDKQRWPTSYQQPPRIVRSKDEGLWKGSVPPTSGALEVSRHHSQTFPCMSCRP